LSQVIVYERKTGRLLAGPNAPTAENLKTWLQKNPTFEVVRPGTLSTIKPNISKKRSFNESNKIQTTLNFERLPRKSLDQPSTSKASQPEPKTKIQQVETKAKILTDAKPKVQETKLKTPQSDLKLKIQQLDKSPKLTSPKEEVRTPKTPIATRSHPLQYPDTPKASTSTAKSNIEPRKLSRVTSRAQSAHDKVIFNC
jgi:hypothetical protein